MNALGNEVPMTVIEYIMNDLQTDGLAFHNPLHRQILAEAAAHMNDEEACTPNATSAESSQSGYQQIEREFNQRPLSVEQIPLQATENRYG